MGRYRTINVDLNRQYRNDLNANFAQIEADILALENSDLQEQLMEELVRIERESKERDNALVKQNLEVLLQSIEDAKSNANTAAAGATTQATHAKTQGDYAKAQGDYAKGQGDYASLKGDYANEKAIEADTAAGRANQEATGLESLKVAVVDATQSANTAAGNAQTQGDYAKEQGDYAKRMADDIADQAGVTSVNNKTGAVTLGAADVGAIPTTVKGVPNGVAGLNAAGKVVDSAGNEVEGKVKSVNNVEPDGDGNIELTIPDLSGTNSQLANHESRLNILESGGIKASSDLKGLNREVAYLKLIQEADLRLPGGTVFADDMGLNRFGFELNEAESENVKIRDGKMLMIEDVTAQHTAVDKVVVNQAYSTAGNGDRKLVRMSNGYLFSVMRDGLSPKIYKSIDEGVTWNLFFTTSSSNVLSDVALVSINASTVGLFFSGNNWISFISFNAVTGVQIARKDIESQTAVGNVSLAIDPTNGHLHAAWASKNSTYPNSFNIRYSKSIDGGVTWNAVEQVTKYNDSAINLITPTIICSNGNPILIYSMARSGSEQILFARKTSDWSNATLHAGGSYVQSSPSAVVDKDGVIHVAWHGRDATHTTTDYIRYSVSIDGGSAWSAMKKLQVGTNASISINSSGHIFITYHYAGVTKFIKSTDKGANWAAPATIGNGTNPSTLVDDTLNATKPLTARMGTSNVLFSGEWTEMVEEPRTTSSAVYDIPSTDFVGAFVEKTGDVTIAAYLNDVLMNSDLDGNEYQFDGTLSSKTPAKLRLELSRASITGGESDGVARILGGRS